MGTLYRLSHNSFEVKGTPWVTEVEPRFFFTCPSCGKGVQAVTAGETISGTLDPRKGTFWPDALGCGAAPLLILSQRFLEVWRGAIGVGLPAAEFRLRNVPTKLSGIHQPAYYWINGIALAAARMDFEASGFFDARACRQCGGVVYDVSRTYDLQQGGFAPAIRFLGLPDPIPPLFTSDLSTSYFFCTSLVLEMATCFRLTNLRFIPVEWGAGYFGKARKYLDQE